MNKKAISVKNDSILMTSILTADNVNSRKTQDVSWLINSIKKILNMYEASPKTWGIYRRYSFQLEINSCENALLTALQIKSALKSTENIDVRIGIGIGKKEFSTSKITEYDGEAFINSGFAFDNYHKKQHLAIKTPWKKVDEELNIAFDLVLLTINSWTQNSAEIFKLSLENKDATQKEISKILGISQSSVSERQKRAGFEPIMKLEKHFRKLIQQKIQV